jgi:hypothetical protein
MEEEFFKGISLVLADLKSCNRQDVGLTLIDSNANETHIENSQLSIVNNFLNLENFQTFDIYSNNTLMPFNSSYNNYQKDENFLNTMSDSMSANLVTTLSDSNLLMSPRPQEPSSLLNSSNTSNLTKDLTTSQEIQTYANHSLSNHNNPSLNLDLPILEEPNSCTNGSHKSLVSSVTCLNTAQSIESPVAADLFNCLGIADSEIPMTAETLIETYGCGEKSSFGWNENSQFPGEFYGDSLKNSFLINSANEQLEIDLNQQQISIDLNLPVSKQLSDEFIPMDFFDSISQEFLNKCGTKSDHSSININSMVPLVPELVTQSESKVLKPFSSRESISTESLPFESFSSQSLKQKPESMQDSKIENSQSEIQSIETIHSSQILNDHSLDLIEEVKCYKCKLCDNISLLKTAILDHISNVHHFRLDQAQKPVAPTYLCSKCFDSFSSLQDCHQHMFFKHKSNQICLQKVNEKENDQRVGGGTGVGVEVRKLKTNNDINGQELKALNKMKPILPNNVQNLSLTSKPFIINAKNILSQRSQLTPSNQPLIRKKKIKREDGSSTCQYKGCNIRFKCSDNLQYHHKCHNESSSGFTCAQCDAMFDHWSSLAGHLWRKHLIDMELHKCDLCSYRTYSLSNLENIHKRIHFNERNFICEICKKGFKNHKQLINHRVKHRTELENGTAKESLSKHVCNLCDRTFNDSRLLRTHFDIVHKKLRPFICIDCGYSAASRSALKSHLRSHTGEKPFKCEKCNYTTSDHNSLRRHKMRHSGERPYKCPFCPYACIQSSTYKQHLRNKHPGKDQGLMFICSFCQFKTVNQQVYKTHLSEHKFKPLDSINNQSSLVQSST